MGFNRNLKWNEVIAALTLASRKASLPSLFVFKTILNY